MNDEFLSIQKAGEFLGVSSSTLRRWEEKGVLVPERTVGNQRRYALSALLAFKNRDKQPPVTDFQPQQSVSETQISPIAENYAPTFTPPVPVPPQPLHTDVHEERANLTDKYFRKLGHPSSQSLIKKGAVFAGVIAIILSFLITSLRPDKASVTSASGANNPSVLAAETKGKSLLAEITFNIPSVFNEKVTLHKTFQVDGKSLFNEDIKVNNKNVDLGTGKITASNVVYGITAGDNVSISGDPQNPVISLAQNEGVQSVQGQTGAVTFTAGSGISLEGTEITNSDPGSAQNIFKNIIVDATAFAASSNTDTLKFVAGSGITLTSDTSAKSITINSNSSGTLSGLTTNGVLYAQSSTTATSTTPGTTGTVLKGVTGSAPVFAAIDLSADVTGLLPVGNGGTGVGSTPSNGQILIGNGTGYTLATITAGTGIGVSNGSGTISITNNGVTSLTGTANQVNLTAGTGAITVSLPQNIHTSATPTFASMTLTANTNQLTLGTGTTGTITMATLTSGRTYTLPDASGDVCLSSGNCSGLGGITGSGTTNFLPRFSGATSVTDSIIYDSGGKIGIGTTSPQGLFSVSGAATGKALVNLNETGGQNILVGSASGITRFVFDGAGNLNIVGGTYQIDGTAVITATSLGTGITTSSLTTVGALNSGSITSGFGTIDTGSDDISGGNVTATGTTGFTSSGNGAGLTFSGSGNHDITASSGTLRVGALTLNGAVSGNSQNVTGLNNLSAGGTITFGSFSSNGGILFTNASGQVTQVAAGTATQVLHGGTNPSFGAVALGTDTTGNYVADVSAGSGIGISGTPAAGWTPTVALGPLTAEWNQTGAFDITLNNASSELRILESAGASFYGTFDVADLSNNRTYTFPDNAGTVCLVEAGNCAGSGTGVTTAGGTTDRLVKFTGSQAVGNASINDLYSAGVAVTISSNGSLGIGSTSPLAGLDVRGPSNTAPAASFSGSTTNAALVIDNNGTGDVLTASKSGAVKFVINNNGNLQFAGNTSFLNTFTSLATQNRTYTLPDANGTICLNTGNCAGAGGGLTGSGTNGQIAFFNGSGTLTSETTGFAWDATNKRLGIGNDAPIGKVDVQGAVTGKALTILNETGNQDILTGSASGTTRFVFDRSGNLNIVGGAYQIGGTSVLSSTALGTGVTGSSLTSTGILTGGSIAAGFGSIVTNNSISGNILGISGTTVIDASRNLTNIAGVGTNLNPTANNTYSLGASGNQYQNIYGQTVYQNGNQVCDTSGNCAGQTTTFWNQNNGAISAKNTTVDLLVGGITSASAKFAVLNINSGTPTASLSGSTGGTYVTAAGTIQSTNNQTLTIGGESTGNITLSPLNGNGTVFNTGNLNLANGKVLQINGTTVLSGTALGSGVTSSSLTTVGALASGSIASGFGTIVTNNTIQGTDVTATGATGFTGSGNGAGLTFSGTGNHDITASSGTLRLGAVTLNGAVDGGSQNLTNLANLAAAGTITFSSFTGNNALLYATSGTGQVASSTTNTSGQCLLSGAAIPVWSTCPGGTNYFELKNGLLYNGNLTTDFAIGGLSSTSAKFLVSPSGTRPTASVSGNTASAGLVVDNNGVGDVFTASSSGLNRFVIKQNGNIGIGTATPTNKLHVVGGGSVFLVDTDAANGGTIQLGNDATSGDIVNIGVNGQLLSQAARFGINSTLTQPITFEIAGAERARLDASGNFAINTTSALATLDVRGNAATIPAASLSASTTNASLIVDNNGSGDLFTASKSGATKFTVLNNGNIQISNLTTAGGLLYTNGTGTVAQIGAGNVGQCLISNGSGNAPGYGSCSSGTNYWQSVNTGTIAPYNDTVDLLVGGTATSSAKFSVLGMAAGTNPTASVSATSGANNGNGISLAGDGSIQSLRNNTLTLGGGTTGNIILNPLNGSGRVGINTTAPTATFDVNGSLAITGTARRILADFSDATFANRTLFQSSITNGITSLGAIPNGTATESRWTIWNNSNPATAPYFSSRIDTNRAYITSGNDGGNPLAIAFEMQFGTEIARFDTNGRFGVNSTSPLATLDVRGNGFTTPVASFSGSTGIATMVVDQTNIGDIFTASKGGATKFVLTNAGNVGIGTANPQAKLSISDIDGTEALRIQAPTSNTYLGMTNQSLYLQRSNGSTTSLTIATQLASGGWGSGTAGAIQFNPRSTNALTLNSSATTAIASVSGNTTIAGLLVDNNGTGDLFTASKSGATKFVITNAGNVGIGTAMPTRPLEVSGNGNQYARISSTDSNEAGLELVRPNGFNSWGMMVTNNGELEIRSSTDRFGTSNTLARFNLATGLTVGGFTNSLATLDIRNILHTAPTASLSGATSFAAQVVDQSGTGDLFTASKSGATKFTILNSGNLQLANYTTGGGLLYTTNTGTVAQINAGSLGECLISNGAGNAPSYGSCGSGSGTNYWNQNLGLTYLGNLTSDFAIGGLSSASANFLVSPSTTRPTASISGNTNQAALVVDNRSAGDLFTASSSGLNRFVIKQNGNVGIGLDNPLRAFEITRNGTTWSNSLGSGQFRINSNDSVSTALTLSNTDTNGRIFSLASTGNTACSNGSFTIVDNTDNNNCSSVRLTLNSQGLFGLNSGTSTGLNIAATLDVRGKSATLPIASFSGSTNFATAVVDQTGTGDLFTASKSGKTHFVIKNNGSANIMNRNVLNFYTDSGATLRGFVGQEPSSNDLALISKTASAWLRLGSAAGGAISFWTDGNADVNTTPQMILNSAGRLGIGTGSSNILATLDVRAQGTTSYTQPVASFSGQTGIATLTVDNSGVGDLFTASKSGATKFVITNAGNVGIGTTLPTKTLDIAGEINMTGNQPTSSTGNGANAISSLFTGGKGGNTTGTSGQTAGSGGSISITAGAGGDAPGGSANGAGGTIFIDGGAAGSGAGSGNFRGNVILQQSGGQVGIGTLSPQAFLHINASDGFASPLLRIVDSGTSSNRFEVKQNGSIGIGAQTPLATLDLRGNSGTTPLASFSGQTAFAGMIVDNNGTGDIFTASKSGATKFVINNGGNVGIGATASSVDKLVVGGNINLSTDFANLYGQNLKIWGQTNSPLYLQDPGSSTGSVGIGVNSNTTPLATLDVRANSFLTPVASFSGSTGIATVIVDQTNIGDIFTASKSGATKFVIKNDGSIGVGTSTPVAGTFNLNLNNAANADSLLIGNVSTKGLLLTDTGASLDIQTYGQPLFINNNSTAAQNTYINPGVGLVGIGTQNPVAKLDVRGFSATTPIASFSGSTNLAGMVVDNTGSGDLFTASKSGQTKFVIKNDGSVGINLPSNRTAATATLDVRGNSNSTPVASIAGATNLAALVVNNTGSGDIFTASKSGATKFTVKNTGTVIIGDATNGITFDPIGGGTTYTGGARLTKQVKLSAEYPGAILTASGSASTNGFMTSEASSSASQAVSNYMSYYEWTSSQTSNQEYNVAVRFTLPSDFSAWATTNAITITYNTELGGNGSNKLDLTLYNTDISLTAAQASTPVTTRSNQNSTAKTWTNIALDDSELDVAARAQDIDTAGDTAILYLKMTSKDNNHVQVGDITLNYLAKF